MGWGERDEWRERRREKEKPQQANSTKHTSEKLYEQLLTTKNDGETGCIDPCLPLIPSFRR